MESKIPVYFMRTHLEKLGLKYPVDYRDFFMTPKDAELIATSRKSDVPGTIIDENGLPHNIGGYIVNGGRYIPSLVPEWIHQDQSSGFQPSVKNDPLFNQP